MWPRLLTPGVMTLDMVTLAVAIIGAVTGVAALVIQGWHFRRSGAVIAVDLRVAWVKEGSHSVILTDVEGLPTEPPAPGYDKLVLAVGVRNRGRSAATIEHIGIRVPTGLEATMDRGTDEAPIRRVEPESSEKWFFDPLPILELVERLGEQKYVCGVAGLGSGRTVLSDWHRLDWGEQLRRSTLLQ